MARVVCILTNHTAGEELPDTSLYTNTQCFAAILTVVLSRPLDVYLTQRKHGTREKNGETEWPLFSEEISDR